MRLETVFEYFTDLQQNIASQLAAFEQTDDGDDGDDGWTHDAWRNQLGEGLSLRRQEGAVFERAGVNYSRISGDALPAAATARHPQLAGQAYRAGGVSVVTHPRNPYCPTAHLNVRVFAAETAWWFGGGMDLTPYYGFESDCRHFHQTCHDALAAVDGGLYARFKQQCDEYFYIRHRGERRGVGGVFFDDFCERSFAYSFAVMRAVGGAFVAAYAPIVRRRMGADFGERQRRWQQYRRGRYIEFNLVYDRGTLFGLQAGGEPERILMSLPPTARFGAPADITDEETELTEKFLPIQNWL